MENSIKKYAKWVGFDLVGITDSAPFLEDETIALKRVRDGFMGGLPWYTEERVKKMNRPTELLPGARSVISLATSYYTDEPDEPVKDVLVEIDLAIENCTLDMRLDVPG